MSEEFSVSNTNQNNSLTVSNRLSTEGSIYLNDDLAGGSEYSSSSLISQTGQNFHKRSGSVLSFRNSIDADSSFSSSVYFQIFNNPNNQEDNKPSNDTFSSLGPNSIFELTIGSDTARIKRSRAPKSTVTINGGLTTVNNLKSPTTKEIPQIQLSKLKDKVSNDELERRFLTDSAEEYKSFESSYKLLTEDTLQRFTEQNKLMHDRRSSESSSMSNFKDINSDLKENDGLSSIPKVFLDPDFRLDDPRIFKQVIENCKILQDESDDELSNTQLVNNTQLQEKLSNYLDVVEVNLIKAIAKSSDSFFSTIGDIQEIRSQSKECAERLHTIMNKLKVLEEEKSQSGLNILNKITERKSIEYFESSLLQLQYITSLFELANKSFNNGKYSKCLNEIVVIELLINGIEHTDVTDEEVKALYPELNYPLANLSKLPALVNLRNDLETLKVECSKGYIDNFVDLLLDDLRNHYNSVSTQDTLNRICISINRTKKYHSKSINNSYQNIDDSKKEKLKEFIKNLAKAGQLTQSYATYQDRIIAEIKDIIKVNLPNTNNQGGLSSVDMSNTPSRSSSVPPESSSSSSSQIPSANNTLSSNIKSLTPKEFESMITKIYATLSECLRCLTVHQKVLLDLALTAIPPSSSKDIDVLSLDITFAINKAIELTQVRLTKVNNVRSEQTADLNLQFYLRLYAVTSAYLQECELINPGYVGSGAGNSLNEWFKHHVNFFIHRSHSNSLKALVANCDREIWKEITQPEILNDYQNIIDELIGYSEYIHSNGRIGFSGEAWLNVLDLHETTSLQEELPKSTIDNSLTKLKIGNDSFMIPNLTLKSLKQVKDYIMISKVFPTTLSVIENNILNYFKLMNSKASQAVLNAGATRTAGLKHITTKHLALCIQLVEFNISLLTNLQNIFKTAKGSSPLIQSNNQPDELTFARIISNYKDHENELFSKLVSIMADRTINHCSTIAKIDWSEPIKPPKQCHPYMETLVKDTTTVTKVLSKYLPELKCSIILSQIFDNYKKLFVQCFCTQLPQFKDFNEKQSALKDIDYFRVKLCEIPGYGNSGQVIWENVNSLPTIEDMKMDQVMRNNIDVERQQSLQSAKNSKKNSLEIEPRSPKDTTPSKIESDEQK